MEKSSSDLFSRLAGAVGERARESKGLQLLPWLHRPKWLQFSKRLQAPRGKAEFPARSRVPVSFERGSKSSGAQPAAGFLGRFRGETPKLLGCSRGDGPAGNADRAGNFRRGAGREFPEQSAQKVPAKRAPRGGAAFGVAHRSQLGVNFRGGNGSSDFSALGGRGFCFFFFDPSSCRRVDFFFSSCRRVDFVF